MENLSELIHYYKDSAYFYQSEIDEFEEENECEVELSDMHSELPDYDYIEREFVGNDYRYIFHKNN